ncbi:protein SAND-like isoform X2 [Corticium candelabrum]|nr:protein SAND-like isoform X2 [Corticium candelabrum]
MDDEFEDVPDDSENPGGSTQVFGSLAEDDSLTKDISRSYEDTESENMSPRRLTACAMRQLSKAARALSMSVGDSDNEQKGENGPIFDYDVVTAEEFAAVSQDSMTPRTWTVLETSSRDESPRFEADDAVYETKGETTSNLAAVSESTTRDVEKIETVAASGSEDTTGKGLLEDSKSPSGSENRLVRQDSAPTGERDFINEDVNDPAWIQHSKHIFLLSEAGKPIYCRYGSEDKLVTLMGVMQALISFIQDDGDILKSIQAGDHKFVFLVKSPVVLVAISRTQESDSQLFTQLNLVFQQVLSVLTYTQLVRIFQQRRNYDLRRLLSGTEKFIDNLLNLVDREPSFLLGAVKCLPLPANVRDNIGNILQQQRVKELVFAILIAENQLITLLRPKKHGLYPQDLHLVFNLVDASTSFRTAESWSPICLPKFDNTGYLHAHVSYLEDDCPACLLLLSTEKDKFFTLSDCKKNIVERMKSSGCMQAINDSLARESYRIEQIGISDLRHFVYKSKGTLQYTAPGITHPYTEEEDRERLMGLYQYLHHRIHSSSRPLKILFHVGSKETVLGWVTPGFELYVVFGPLVTKPVAISSVNKLLRWIKHEEDRLFILSSQTY